MDNSDFLMIISIVCNAKGIHEKSCTKMQADSTGEVEGARIVRNLLDAPLGQLIQQSA